MPRGSLLLVGDKVDVDVGAGTGIGVDFGVGCEAEMLRKGLPDGGSCYIRSRR